MRLLLLLSLACLGCAADGWVTGWNKASELAKTGNLPILADFTGSDWCSWCIKLKQEVFSTPEFTTWAKGKVVLLEVDFPRKTKLEAALAAENKALLTTSNVEGFPTIVFFNAAGKELGRLGYQPGGPQAWLTAADKILAAKP